MNHISSTICVGAPNSPARYEQFKDAPKALPICAHCVGKAPLSFSFLPLCAQSTPLIGHSQCYICEDTTSVAFCKGGTL